MSPDGDVPGGGADGTTPGSRPWRDRLDDPDEPLYTLAVAADLLDMDSQALRRLGDVTGCGGGRPSGNQRRYSRADLEVLSSAADLSGGGVSSAAIGRILALEREVASLTEQLGGRADRSRG